MAAQGIEQNKAQSELKQAALEQQQHSVIQPLACAPEHCVYICNLTYPLGSQRGPPPTSLVLLSLSLSLHHHHHVLSLAPSPRVHTLSLPLAQSLSSPCHCLFFSYTKIQSSKYAHALSHIDTHAQTHRGP